MDPEAARRARAQKILKEDLLKAFTDEEACPPEWVELRAQIRELVGSLRAYVGAETDRFRTEPDVRVALERRERVSADVAARIERINEKVRRLNLIAPLARFQLPGLVHTDEVRPLYRTRREPRAS